MPQPNIVLIMVDDADRKLFDNVPRIKAAIADQGATAPTFLLNHPVCAPSRASRPSWPVRAQHRREHERRGVRGVRRQWWRRLEPRDVVARRRSTARRSSASTSTATPDAGTGHMGAAGVGLLVRAVQRRRRLVRLRRERQRHGRALRHRPVRLRDRRAHREGARVPRLRPRDRTVLHDRGAQGATCTCDPGTGVRGRLPGSDLPAGAANPSFNEEDVPDKPLYVRRRSKAQRTPDRS